MLDWFLNLKKMDWVINVCLLIFATASLLTIYGVSRGGDLFWAQLSWFIIALIIIIVVSQLDWRPLVNYRWIIFAIYLFTIALLLATYFFAPAIRGTRAWLVLGSFQLQTSELVKLSLIILFSYYFAQRHVGIAHWQNILIPFLYFLLPAILILLQPDTGTALILFVIWFGYLLISGIRWRHLLLGLILFIILASVGWSQFLADYQRERLKGLVNPEYDPLGVNYSVIQSKIAIGSGGFWGKGFMQGTQVQLGFLPEAASDFILAAFVEEWGLVGAIVLLGAFLILIWRIISIGLTAENNFGKLICLGVVIFLLVHFLLNAGSTTGLVPVIGIPFSFFSYGGSNLLTSAILIGIIQSIAIRFSF